MQEELFIFKSVSQLHSTVYHNLNTHHSGWGAVNNWLMVFQLNQNTYKNRLFKLTTFTCDSMWYMYIESTGVPSVVSTDTMKIHGWKQSMCMHQLEYNKQQTDLVLSPSYFGFFNSGVESSSPDPLLWLDSYKWHDAFHTSATVVSLHTCSVVMTHN